MDQQLEILSKAGCINNAVAVLGDKWTPLLIRALAMEPKRFCQLQDDAGGVNPRTLSGRLSSLEAEGIVIKTTYSEIPPHTKYELSDKGRELLPILEAMALWSERHVARPVMRHKETAQ